MLAVEGSRWWLRSCHGSGQGGVRVAAVEVAEESSRWWPWRWQGGVTVEAGEGLCGGHSGEVVSVEVAKRGHGGGREGWRCWPWWQQKWLKDGEGGDGHGHDGSGHGGCAGHGGHCCGSRPDPAVPGAISPLPRGLVPVHWVGSLSAESEGHWG